MIRYRVECNFGSRYFEDNEKALKYFNKCKDKHFDVELWLVLYLYSPLLDKFSASQELKAYSGMRLPIH